MLSLGVLLLSKHSIFPQHLLNSEGLTCVKWSEWRIWVIVLIRLWWSSLGLPHRFPKKALVKWLPCSSGLTDNLYGYLTAVGFARLYYTKGPKCPLPSICALFNFMFSYKTLPSSPVKSSLALSYDLWLLSVFCCVFCYVQRLLTSYPTVFHILKWSSGLDQGLIMLPSAQTFWTHIKEIKHFRMHFQKMFWEIKYLGMEKLGPEVPSLLHCVAEQKVDAGEDCAQSV